MSLRSADSGLRNDLDGLWSLGTAGSLTDGELLERFLRGGPKVEEAAFTVLVERHGPMVLRVCRQVLGDTDEAQDAFQATFLVFVRRAHSVRKQDSVASWLHGVARRVSRRAKVDAARRRKHERLGAEKAMESRDSQERAQAWPELHDAIARLPQRYREPTVLCYLEGLTTEAVALRIGCPQGTVLSRLSRARERLRVTLTRQGLAVPAGFLMTGLAADSASAALPPGLLVATVHASLMFAGHRTATALLGSYPSVVLARGVLSTMTISKLKVFGAVALASIFAFGGVQTFGQFGGMGGIGSGSPPIGQSREALTHAVERLQNALDRAKRQNDVFQEQLNTIQKRLQALEANEPKDQPKEPVAKDVQKPATLLRRELARRLALERGFPADSGDIQYQRYDRYVVVFPKRGDKITVHDTVNKKNRSYRLASPEAEPLQLATINGPGAVALLIEGAKITRIAASNGHSGTWQTQDLREPVSGKAVPIVGPNVAAYALGRYVYAYSPSVQRWDVAELPEGIEARPVVGPEMVTVEGGGHCFTFLSKTGKWDHIDLHAILDAANEEEPEEAAPKK